MSQLTWDQGKRIVKLTSVCSRQISNIKCASPNNNIPRILADPEPHDKEDCRHDQAEFDDEGVEVGGGLGHDVAHQVDPPAREVVKLDRSIHPELCVLIGVLQQVVAIQALAVGVWVIAWTVQSVQNKLA